MFAAEDRQWWYAGMRAISRDLLAPLLAPGSPRRLLDAGCGSGANVAWLAGFGSAFGIDVSAEALGLSRRRGVRVARASVLALPFPDTSFDVVTCFDVLYHRWVVDDRAALGELRRVLRPGGLLLVRVPALRLLWGAHDEAVHSRHRYTRGEVVALLRSAGFEPGRASYANFFLFPLLLVRRSLDRLLSRHGSDVGFLPAPVEALFRGLLLLEARLIPRLTLPIGASVVALARRL